MKNIENILKTYIEPFSVKDGKPKTEKELNTWAGTDAGAQAMGVENASAFKTANPTFFGADGKLTILV